MVVELNLKLTRLGLVSRRAVLLIGLTLTEIYISTIEEVSNKAQLCAPHKMNMD
jgi:hypothetical protein